MTCLLRSLKQKRLLGGNIAWQNETGELQTLMIAMLQKSIQSSPATFEQGPSKPPADRFDNRRFFIVLPVSNIFGQDLKVKSDLESAHIEP